MAAPQGIVRVYDDGKAVTFQVVGRVTMTQSLPLRRCAEQALAAGAKALRVDLRHCTYMDSTFLGALLILQRAAGRGQCPLTLVSPSPTCCRLLQQMGLHGHLPVVTAEEDPAGPCTTLSSDAEDVPALRCNVVQAHQELAHVAGPGGDVFRAMAPFLKEEAEKKR